MLTTTIVRPLDPMPTVSMKATYTALYWKPASNSSLCRFTLQTQIMRMGRTHSMTTLKTWD